VCRASEALDGILRKLRTSSTFTDKVAFRLRLVNWEQDLVSNQAPAFQAGVVDPQRQSLFNQKGKETIHTFHYFLGPRPLHYLRLPVQ
jgi:hypothetical protein